MLTEAFLSSVAHVQHVRLAEMLTNTALHVVEKLASKKAFSNGSWEDT
jgi:hypothetical protein